MSDQEDLLEISLLYKLLTQMASEEATGDSGEPVFHAEAIAHGQTLPDLRDMLRTGRIGPLFIPFVGER